MGEPSADFSAEGVKSSSCLCRNTCEKPGCEHSYACWKDGQDDLVVVEIGMALTEVTHAYGDDEDEGPGLDEDSSDDDDPVHSMESDSSDDLVDVDSELAASPSGDASESSISRSADRNSSIHGTSRLVSAMKGTRAKQGIMMKLSVSWAPDVYDPPVTSDSHTVRGHQRSSRKGQYKYKPSKSGSSSHSSSGSKKDKKHSRHSSSGGGGSSSSSKKDKKHSYRSTSTSGSNRTDTSSSHYRKAYSGGGGGGISSSRTATCVPESAKVSSLVVAESDALPDIVPVLKTMEPIKCATSCGKEKPFAMLSRQFSPARYKGMFSFWSQNQLAS